MAAGTYPDHIFLWKPLTLLGAQAGNDARTRTGIGETILGDGLNLGSNLGFTSAGSVIDGFTFSGGSFGIMTAQPPTTMTVDGLVVRNNRFIGQKAGAIALWTPGIDVTIDRNLMAGPPDHPDALVSLRGEGSYDGFHLTNNAIVGGGPGGFGFTAFHPATHIGSSTRAPLIRGNRFSGNEEGASIQAAFQDGEISDNQFDSNRADGLHGAFARTVITRNFFVGNGGGIHFDAGVAPGTITTNQITGNAFVDNQFGAWYDGNETIDVAGNYWGAASGPYHPVRNPGGVGDTVMDQQAIPPGTGSGRLFFDPWLTTSPIPLPSAKVWCVPVLASGCDAFSPTIWGAVNAAWPGDIVKVAAGTYNEEGIWITKQLTLRGAQAGIDARNRAGPESIVTTPNIMAPIVALTPGSAGTIIDGFTLRGGDIGIQTNDQSVASISGLQILNNRIDQFWAAGIALGYPGNDITIEGNYVDGSNVNHPDMLVSVRASGPYHGLWLTNNTIVNGRGQAIGFSVFDGAAQVGPSARLPRVTGNTFLGNSVGANLGRHFDGGEIRDNVFTASVSHGLQGTLTSTLVVGNAFEGNGGIGMSLASGSSGNTITDNTFVGNHGGGLAAAPLASTLLARNIVRSNGVGGPAISVGAGGTNNTIIDNDVRDNLGDGIRGGLYESLLSRNVIEGNRGFALILFSAARDNTVTANLLLGNGRFDACNVAADPTGCGGGINFGTLTASQFANNITGNTISGNAVGAVYYGTNATQVRDLRGNDWGTASGPYHATRNPTGTGNAVVDHSSTTPPSGPGMILFDPWIGIGYTPAGSNVDVDVTAALPGGSTAWVGIGFDEVVSAGRTSVTTSSQGPAPPAGFQLGKPPVYYDVATTATFSGNVEVCFTWTEGQFHNEKMIRLQHYEANAWVDVTTSVGTAENVACGRVTSLSAFALMEVAYAFTGFNQPIANPPALNTVKAGQSVSVKFSLGGFRGLDIFDPGYPKSGVIDCANPVNPTAFESTVLTGTSVLQYEPTTDAYIYVWKTMPGWAKTCRVLVIDFLDGSRQTAYFQFRQ